MTNLAGPGLSPLAAAISVTLALAASSASAQTSASSEQQAKASPLEEIVVTARYREERLQDTPIAITAITAEDIQVRALSSSYEIGYSVPNASLRPAQAAYGNTMTAFIRGIGQYDFLPEFEPGVGIYFDDVLHPVTMGSMVDLMDLERVEVLRGPQGTLFGRGSIGGAIRYVSKKPRGDNTGSVSVTTGDFDRLDVRGSYDFAITDNAFVRITGASKSRDGYQKVYDFACANPDPAVSGTLPTKIPNRLKGCKLGTQGGQEVSGGRAALRLVANDDLEFLFTADYQDDQSEVRADSLIDVVGPGGPFATWSEHYLLPNFGVRFDDRFVPPDIYTTYGTYDDPLSGLKFEPKTALRQEGYSGKADWQITPAVRSELILSYREFESQFSTDADQSPLNEQTVDGRQEFDSKTAELRFSGRAFDRLDWTVGGFYYKGKFKTAQTVSIPAFIFSGVYGGAIAGGATVEEAEAAGAFVIDNVARFLVNGLNITESENKSAFAHGVFDLTDRLSLTAGLRYSTDDKADDFDNNIVVTTLDTSDSRTDWKAGIDFKLTDDALIYASAATGYRPQAFNPRPFQYTQFVSVDAEEATSYELGVKGDFLDRSLRFNVAGFYIDYSKRIVPVGGTECLIVPGTVGAQPPQYQTVPPGTPGAITDGLGNICVNFTSRTYYQNFPGEVTGGEVELTWRPVDPLTISGIYGYTHFTGDDLDRVIVVNKDRPIFVPEQNWNVSIQYEFGLGGGSTITPRVDVYGQTELCSQSTTKTSCADGYELVNARLEWASPDRAWQVALGVTNATDEEYFLNIFDLSAFGQPTIEGQPGPSQEWYLSLTRNFF